MKATKLTGILVVLLACTVEGVVQTRAAFPPIGGSASQTVNIHLIALGDNGTGCGAALGFRLIPTGEPVGPIEVTYLRLGQTKTIRQSN